MVKTSEVLSSGYLDDILLCDLWWRKWQIFILLTHKLVSISSVNGVTDFFYDASKKKSLLLPIGTVQFYVSWQY